ncbi:MAG TPA: glycosyl transferase [Syntrophus sp. (in: bacteria)]|nr:glycosyl transferase [Syntrophus sp. (in: bacteria)]
MKISIITATWNSSATIENAILSVASQGYPDLEHIIVDGNSSDATLPIVFRYENLIDKLISEPDHGIYDAMNKGISLSTGEVIGILNSDDFYANPHVLEKVSRVFEDKSVDTSYGDLIYVDPTNVNRITRYWKASAHHPRSFYQGWMPPHPTFFVRRSIYEKYGYFNVALGTAADYELTLRLLLKHKVSTTYIPEVLVHMRAGGASNASLKSRLATIQMANLSWQVNDLKPWPWTLTFRLLSKIVQYTRVQ